MWLFDKLIAKRKALDWSSKLPPAVFLHIQKTAGTTILERLRQSYGLSMISHGDFIGHKPEEFRNIKLVSGHFGYAYARYFLPSRFSFTFLRDPIERVLSYYYYCRAQNSSEFSTYIQAKTLDLHQFLEAGAEDMLIRKNVWNNQAWQLAHGFVLSDGYAARDRLEPSDVSPDEILTLALSHLNAFSFVGFADTFEADCDSIFTALNLPTVKSRSFINSNPNRPRAQDLPTKTLHLLKKMTSLDQILYDTAKLRCEST